MIKLFLLLMLMPSLCFAATTKGDVGNAISIMPKSEIEAYKIDQYIKLKTPIVYTYNGIDIIIEGLSQKGKLLKVDLIASRDGKELKLRSPYWFKNPPIYIRDTTYTEIQKTLPKGIEFEPTGTSKDISDQIKGLSVDTERNYIIKIYNSKEDLLEALKEMVGQTVYEQAN